MRKKLAWLIVILFLGLLGAGGAVLRYRHTELAYTTVRVDRGSVRDVVEATGTINAVTTVQVGSQVSGTITKLYVDFNSHVSKGQVIAEIDPRLYEGQVLQARADLTNAKALLAASKSNLLNAKAKATQTRADYARIERLAKEGVLSQQQLDSAKAQAEANDAQVAANEAQIEQASAQIEQKEAMLRVTETNLAYTKIIAPVDGTVVNRAVDVGQTVAASFQTPTLFTIAQDLKKMQVYVSTDEGDVGQIRQGQKVTFRVDAFPNDVFKGRVSQVRMNPTTVQNVVTYNTIVDFDNPELKLFPGMTAYVTVPVAIAENVLRVSNVALRYKPNRTREELMALCALEGISANDLSPAEEATGAGLPVRKTAVLWKVLPDQSTQPVLVQTGVTDHRLTAVAEVLKGKLAEGDLIVGGEEEKSSSGPPPPPPGQ
jgi:HlyD family secretion protein